MCGIVEGMKSGIARRRHLVAGFGLAIIACVAVACSADSTLSSDGAEDPVTVVAPTETTATTASPVPPTTIFLGPESFAATGAAMASRIAGAGLPGGFVRVVRADRIVHEQQIGSVNGSTVLSVASSTKWLTAATLMSLVDDGLVGLDDPVATWLPEFSSTGPEITVRQLLTHTSGVRDNACQGNGTALASCVRSIAGSAREFPPGERFSYGNSDFLVIGRIVEVAGGADFATVVEQRLTGPLAMTATTWPGAPTAANPAFGVRVSVDDYGHFLDMVLHRGMFGGRRILSEAAVAELTGDQIRGYDTAGDFAVGITKIPRYALGAWPDVVDVFGETMMVSGNGGMGFYPWVDYATDSYGIVGVQDERGALVAVPASQAVAISARGVLSGEG